MWYGAFVVLAAVGAVWLATRRPRPRRWLLPRRVAPRAVAAVDRQHRHLQAGGLLGEAACARTAARFRELFAAGRADAVEAELRAGLDFAGRVRALADLGTPDAARVLERLLARKLSRDRNEQSWYWADLAAALRRLGHEPALPAVLRCADAAGDSPQGTLLAAEAVAFPNFADLLRHPERERGRAALRALAAAACAARAGELDLAHFVRAGAGERLADVAARAPHCADPWLTAAVVEAERVFRRLGHWLRFLPPDARRLAERQALRLWATQDRRLEWLAGAPMRLLDRFPRADADERGAALRCLCALRAEVVGLFPNPPDRRAPWWADAVRALRWSRSPVVGPVFAGLAVQFARKPRHHSRAALLLGALGHHQCHEAERALLSCAGAADPALRAAAVCALGHGPPLDPNRVVPALRAARTDPDPVVRQAAVSALARLGERAALAEIANGLTSEEGEIRRGTAVRIAAEELSWFWPDLETAAGSDDPDLAFAATEALESLREGAVGFAR